MRRQDFYYDLPEQLIAKQPAAERRGSRLLCLDGPSGNIEHRQFPDVLEQLNPGDLMVFNNTRVIPHAFSVRRQPAGKLRS